MAVVRTIHLLQSICERFEISTITREREKKKQIQCNFPTPPLVNVAWLKPKFILCQEEADNGGRGRGGI